MAPGWGGVSSGPRNLSRGRNKSWKNGDVSACPHTLERETLRKGTNVCVGLHCSPERTRGRGLKRGDRSSGSPWTRNVLPLCSLLVCGLVINAFLFSSGIKSFPACVFRRIVIFYNISSLRASAVQFSTPAILSYLSNV